MSKKMKGRIVEELLEEVLVPEGEQPFENPSGWVWIKLKHIANIKTGKKDANYGTEDGQFPFFTCAKEPSKSPDYSFDEEALLVAGNGNIGNVMHYNGKFEAYQRTYIISSKNINLKYLYYHMLFSWEQYNRDKLFGSTISYIKLSNLQEYPVIVPPARVQKNIVEQIEKYLYKIVQAQNLIEEAKETFELRRAAILDKAFSGELTRKWRKKHTPYYNNILPLSINTTLDIPKTWILTNFQSIAADEKYSLAIGPFGSNLKVSDYTKAGVPLIFVRNIRSSDYELDRKFVSERKAEELHAHAVNAGDILITKMGDPPGDSDICPDTIDRAIITADCIKLRVNRKLANNRFIMYAIKSPFIQHQIRKHSKGVAQQKITLKIFKELEVPVPHLDEQMEIVKILDKYMASNENIIRNIKMAEDKLELLKQSILSKAFRGELGTNDPSEENAIELLKEVLQEKVE